MSPTPTLSIYLFEGPIVAYTRPYFTIAGMNGRYSRFSEVQHLFEQFLF
jgi:hypothetical protein